MHISHARGTHWTSGFSVAASHPASVCTARYTAGQTANVFFFLLYKVQCLEGLIATAAHTLSGLPVMGGTAISTNKEHLRASGLFLTIRANLMIQ